MAAIHSRSAMAAPFSLSSAFRSLSLSTPKRSFSTTLAPMANKPLSEHIPPYPYGARQWYKQADTGLYGGAMIRFGNKISDGRNKGKTRRSWKPNVTRKALRTIEKEGSLDKYLLGNGQGRIRELGMFGWNLRYQIMQTPKIQEQFQEERQKLGLSEPKSFEEWIKEREDEVEAKIQERLNIKKITTPRRKGQADPQKLAQRSFE
ncbi:unnamed protein product [Penicillium manginii]